MAAKWRSMLLLVTVIFLGLLVVTQSTSTAQSGNQNKIQQWQYHVETGSAFDETTADKLGGHGWELVTVYLQHDGEFRAIYKRRS